MHGRFSHFVTCFQLIYVLREKPSNRSIFGMRQLILSYSGTCHPVVSVIAVVIFQKRRPIPLPTVNALSVNIDSQLSITF